MFYKMKLSRDNHHFVSPNCRNNLSTFASNLKHNMQLSLKYPKYSY